MTLSKNPAGDVPQALSSQTAASVVQLFPDGPPEIPEIVIEPMNNADLTAAVRQLESNFEKDKLASADQAHTFSDTIVAAGRKSVIAVVIAVLAMFIGGLGLWLSARADGRIDTVGAEVVKLEKSKASAKDFDAFKADIARYKAANGKRLDDLQVIKADGKQLDDLRNDLSGADEAHQRDIENLQADMRAKVDVDAAVKMKWRISRTSRSVKRLGNRVHTLGDLLQEKFPDTKPIFQNP